MASNDATPDTNPAPTLHHIEVRRTARYFTHGTFSPKVREVWFVIHGYGQLAEYFIRHFRGLISDGSRVIIAPEGLNRFYVKEWTRVGATWMTREDREHEIADYVQYLNSVAEEVSAQLQEHGAEREKVRIVTLGFSQGVTTLIRWLQRGNITSNWLMCWGGALPAEVDLNIQKEFLNSMNPVFVCGNEDEFITPEVLQMHRTALETAGVEMRFVSFEGGHVMKPDVLANVIATHGSGTQQERGVLSLR
jgi:predicted esterase